MNGNSETSIIGHIKVWICFFLMIHDDGPLSVLCDQFIGYTPGSTNIAGWKMDPLIEDVFPMEKWGYSSNRHVTEYLRCSKYGIFTYIYHKHQPFM